MKNKKRLLQQNLKQTKYTYLKIKSISQKHYYIIIKKKQHYLHELDN